MMKWLRVDILLILVAVIAIVLVVIATVIPPTPKRKYSQYCLKQIGEAMADHEEAYGSLPPRAITDKNGRPLLSWRVDLLPFIGRQDLYDQFHLDEPWDSPHNIKLLAEIPRLYKRTSSSTTTTTPYQVLVQAGSPFASLTTGVSFAEIDRADGISNTILVVETSREVPWTKPEDVAVDTGSVIAKLGAEDEESFHVLMSAGWVLRLPRTINEQELRHAIRYDDGKPGNLD